MRQRAHHCEAEGWEVVHACPGRDLRDDVVRDTGEGGIREPARRRR